MVQLYNDNCFAIMEQLIKDKVTVDAIIADVPYNIKQDEWDKNFSIHFAVSMCNKLIKPNGNILFFQGYSNVCETKLLMDKYWTMQDWIIYDRIKGRGGRKHLVSTREDILWYSNGDDYTFNKIPSNIKKKTTTGLGKKNGCEYRALSNVWTDISPLVPWSKEKVNHPTQKPIQLMDRLVKVFTNEGDVVLDFTMGSGSTGVSCIQNNRNFIGIELNKEYYEIAEQRIRMALNEKGVEFYNLGD